MIDILIDLLWNYPEVNATGPQRWVVRIGSGNGLVLSGNKPLHEPMVTMVSGFHHMASPGTMIKYLKSVLPFVLILIMIRFEDLIKLTSVHSTSTEFIYQWLKILLSGFANPFALLVFILHIGVKFVCDILISVPSWRASPSRVWSVDVKWRLSSMNLWLVAMNRSSQYSHPEEMKSLRLILNKNGC